MYRRVGFLVIILLVFFFQNLYSKVSNFEGTINFIKESVYDTSYISLRIKNDMVRIDEFNAKKSIENSFIVNLSNKTIVALSPKSKFYKVLNQPASPKPKNKNVIIIKTENYIDYNGCTCYQWRVKDILHNTEVAYWVCNRDFAFFEALLKIFDAQDIGIELFTDIPNASGMFPMLTVERTLLRKLKQQIAVVGIKEEHLNDNLFKIPRDHQKIEQQ